MERRELGRKARKAAISGLAVVATGGVVVIAGSQPPSHETPERVVTVASVPHIPVPRMLAPKRGVEQDLAGPVIKKPKTAQERHDLQEAINAAAVANSPDPDFALIRSYEHNIKSRRTLGMAKFLVNRMLVFRSMFTHSLSLTGRITNRAMRAEAQDAVQLADAAEAANLISHHNLLGALHATNHISDRNLERNVFSLMGAEERGADTQVLNAGAYQQNLVAGRAADLLMGEATTDFGMVQASLSDEPSRSAQQPLQ
jgi:hypothetical protein